MGSGNALALAYLVLDARVALFLGATARDLEGALQSSPISGPIGRAPAMASSDRPILVRLRNEDRLLLDARAEARSMRPATYASVILRAHLRKLTPLPNKELLALKRSIAELGALGRNINQIARVLNEGGKAPESVRENSGQCSRLVRPCATIRNRCSRRILSPGKPEMSKRSGGPAV
jgi:hypothetical protein